MKKVISILIISVLLIAGLFVLTGCGDNETATGGSSSNSGNKSNSWTTKVPGLPDYPKGELVRNEQNDDGSGSVYYNNTTLAEFEEYCKSLKDNGIVPGNANFDFFESGEYYFCKNESAGYDYTIKFYQEPGSMTRVTNGVEEKIYWTVSIGYGQL